MKLMHVYGECSRRQRILVGQISPVVKCHTTRAANNGSGGDSTDNESQTIDVTNHAVDFGGNNRVMVAPDHPSLHPPCTTPIPRSENASPVSVRCMYSDTDTTFTARATTLASANPTCSLASELLAA